MSPFTYGGGCIEFDPDDVEAPFEFVRRLVAEAERAPCSVACRGRLVSRECPGLSFPAAAARSGARLVHALVNAYTAGNARQAMTELGMDLDDFVEQEEEP